MPLVIQARDWTSGVYMAATLGSETTAAAAGKVGQVRRDPMAMLPFCGYNVGDYFSHWLGMEHKVAALPVIFTVNWFRVDDQGKFIWRATARTCACSSGSSNAAKAPQAPPSRCSAGCPNTTRFDWTGLGSIGREQFSELMKQDPLLWLAELDQQAEFFHKLGDKLPPALARARSDLASQFAQRLTM